jgi:hypothetical protein
MSTTVSYFSSETADVDLLANRDVYPLDTQEQINVYNAKIISIMNTINATPVPRFEDPTTGYMSIGDMPEAYKEKAKTLILKLYGMYKQITTGEPDPNFGEGNLRNKLFAFNSKYKANLENHFNWWETDFGKKTIERPYGTYRRYGGKKRTHKRKSHVNKSRKNKKKRGNK